MALRFYNTLSGEKEVFVPLKDKSAGIYSCGLNIRGIKSIKYLGATIDIHTGGIDNIFPHHQNEIAQSEAATGQKFVRYWMHCEHLLVDNKKMSKSLGNIITLRDVMNRGYRPEALRYLFVFSHYRSRLNFTWESIGHASNILNRLN
jgi:cysteinyl-tRNA synthetase